MKMELKSFLSSLIVLSFFLGCHDNDVTKRLQEIGNKLNAIESYRADISSEILLSNGSWFKENGSLFYKSPNKEKWVAYPGDSKDDYRVMITNGNIEWSFGTFSNIASYRKIKVPSEKYEENFNQSVINAIKQGKIKYHGKKKYEKSEITIFEFKKSVLLGVPSDHTAVVGIDETNGLPYFVEEHNERGAVVARLKLSDYKLNIPLSDAEFEFKPPLGAQVVDLSERSEDIVDHSEGIRSITVPIEGTGPPEE